MKKAYKSIFMLLCVLIVAVGLKCSLKAKAFHNSDSSTGYNVSYKESSNDNYEPDDPVENFYYTLGYISVPIVIIVLIVVAIISSSKKKKNPYSQQYMGYQAGYGASPSAHQNTYGPASASQHMSPYGQPVNSSAPGAAQQRFCTKCGSRIVGGAVFCVNCGTKV